MTQVDNFAQYDNGLVYPPATRTALTTSAYIDTDEYNSVTIDFIFGATGDTLSANLLWTCTIVESDTAGSGYTAVAAAEIIDGTTTPANSVVVDANGKVDNSYKLGYKGNARYIKGVITPTGSMTYGTILGMNATLGNKRMGPMSQASVTVGA